MSTHGMAAELASELFNEDAAFERLKHDEDCKCHRQIPCRHCVESMIAGAIDTAESVAESKIETLRSRCRELEGALRESQARIVDINRAFNVSPAFINEWQETIITALRGAKGGGTS